MLIVFDNAINELQGRKDDDIGQATAGTCVGKKKR